jgi:hypothetical protein
MYRQMRLDMYLFGMPHKFYILPANGKTIVMDRQGVRACCGCRKTCFKARASQFCYEIFLNMAQRKALKQGDWDVTMSCINIIFDINKLNNF